MCIMQSDHCVMISHVLQCELRADIFKTYVVIHFLYINIYYFLFGKTNTVDKCHSLRSQCKGDIMQVCGKVLYFWALCVNVWLGASCHNGCPWLSPVSQLIVRDSLIIRQVIAEQPSANVFLPRK